MGRVGALFPTWFDPSTCQRNIQQRLQNLLFRFSFDQALAKFTEHRGIEAWISQFQAQQIFPIEPPSNRISRLLIGETFGKLHQTHQQQAPGSFCGLTAVGKQMSKHLVRIDRSEFIANSQVEIAFRIRCTSHTSGFFGNRNQRLGMERHPFSPSLCAITVSSTESPVLYPLLLPFVQLLWKGIRQWYLPSSENTC